MSLFLLRRGCAECNSRWRVHIDALWTHPLLRRRIRLLQEEVARLRPVESSQEELGFAPILSGPDWEDNDND